MPLNQMLTVVAFLATSSLVMLVFLVATGRRTRLDTRLRNLASKDGPNAPEEQTIASFARTTLPKIGTPFVPSDEEERTRLQTRLIHAGLYNRQAMVVLLGLKVFVMFGPGLVCIAASLVGLVTFQTGMFVAAAFAIVGMIGPSFWLDRRKAARQSNFRRALPDALDVMVICLEGGLSLPASMKRMAGELRTAHPALALELNIVQREIQLGRTSGEGLRKMGERTDLEEVRTLASVILQSEKFGASLVKSLRVHSETLRTKRMQRAEELAQAAGTKVLFPTILFILPAMFAVILGPAGIHLMRVFRGMGL